MKVNVKGKEYSFEGYSSNCQSIAKLAEECYEQGRADIISELEENIACANYDHRFLTISMELLWAILEQLKEKKK